MGKIGGQVPGQAIAAAYDPVFGHGGDDGNERRSAVSHLLHLSLVFSTVLVDQNRRPQALRHRFPKLGRLQHLDVRAVLEYVHDQLQRIAVRNTQLIAAVVEKPPLLIFVPTLLGHPAGSASVEPQNSHMQGAPAKMP